MPNAVSQRRDSEGYVDPSSLPPASDFVEASRYDATSPLKKPKPGGGSFGDHTGRYTLPEPYPAFHVTAITHRKDAAFGGLLHKRR